jgi:exonuclease SbcC
VIPLSLHLTDFLSYKEMPEPLDLSGVSLACLSGPNGHGKSALLDAITWSLWGKARGCEGGQGQEQLIRDGADAMRVEFVFVLEGQTFRVGRTRWRSGKGDIAFTIRAADGSWTDLAGEGIADTQRRIVERLRMDYETFVASAFILQGRADTFTTLDPRDRKEILGKILGLEVYERLAERSNERRRVARSEADAGALALAALEDDLEHRAAYESEHATARETLQAAEAERAESAAEVTRLHAALGELRVIEGAAEETRKRLAAAEASVAEHEAESRRLAKRVAELSSEAAVPAGVEGAAERLADLEKKETAAEAARARHDGLAAEAASLDARIAEERSRLEAEATARARAAAQLERELVAEEEAKELLARADGELAALEDLAGRREALLARHAEIRERVGALEAERGARETERSETEEKIALLAEAGAGCPLCGEPLTAAHRKEVRAGFAARLRALDAADKAGAKEQRALAAELASVEREGNDIRTALARRETIAGQAAALKTRLDRMETDRASLAAERAAAGELTARLEAADFAVPEREKLGRVREEQGAAGFDPAEYRALKRALEEARAAERACSRAREARAALDATARAGAEAATRSAQAQKAVESARADLLAMAGRLDALPGLQHELASAEDGRQRAQELVESAGRALAASGHALEVLERKAVEVKRLRDDQAASKRRASLYEKLAKAFGRDGIPARIVGNAIPELRIEANRLLGLLTDGQLAVSIDPVRATKSRGTKETLEVTVFDAQGGKRAYEMYSGGERLRIDFALRVALSRLLARRAGARLETLVIDEGFGSQDAEGRSRLLEAVMRVRSEFATIIVITHIEELKEHFPVRIEVRKLPGTGSRAVIV